VGEAVRIIRGGQSALMADEPGWKEQCSDVLGVLGADIQQIGWVMSRWEQSA
jgi:hypothetical protein